MNRLLSLHATDADSSLILVDPDHIILILPAPVDGSTIVMDGAGDRFTVNEDGIAIQQLLADVDIEDEDKENDNDEEAAQA
jgi:hypothetical protein